jgi:GT2 family glycosyltransferase
MKISVVIPCRNEVNFIAECVEAVYNSIFSSDVELSILIVDGMSDDGTREEIQRLQHQYSNLFLIDNKRQLTPYAFNLGIHFKSYDYIQIVGARHILSPNYIQTSLDILKEQNSIWCAGGKLVNVYVNNQSELISKAMSTSFGMGIGNFRTLEESCFTDTVTSPMYPSWVFDKIGYFDERLVRNQDDDFNYRVTSNGGKIWYENSIHLKYYVRASFSGLKKQFFQYGYWKVFVNQKHKAVTTLRQLVPPLFVLGVLLYPIICLLNISLIDDVLSLSFLAYLTLLVYFSIQMSSNLFQFIGLIQTFLILHFSYGLGYLKGIYHFLILGRNPSEKEKELSR